MLLIQVRIAAALFLTLIGLTAVLVPGYALVTDRTPEVNLWLALMITAGAGITVIGIMWAKEEVSAMRSKIR